MGDMHAPGVGLALFGLAVMGICSVWNVRGAILIGIVATTIAAAATGALTYKPEPYSFETITATVFKLDLPGVLHLSGGLLEILFVFLFVDLFDNIGTLVAVTKRAGLMDESGKIEGLNRILITDATATMVGALAGTSTVTSYVESAAGVEAGGRTGLTAVVTGVLFLLTMFVAPYAQLVPLAATAPALIVVGGLMLLPLTEIAWDDPMSAIPAFLTVALIPLTFSIANGLACGIVAHAVLKAARGQLMIRRDWLLMILAALFVVRFAWLSSGG